MAESTENDGHKRYSLGPVERWIIIAGAGLIIWIVRGSYSQLEEQGKTLNALVTQQAVTNGRLDTLSSQLANIPQLTQKVADLQAKQDDHDRRINRLEEGRK